MPKKTKGHKKVVKKRAEDRMEAGNGIKEVQVAEADSSIEEEVETIFEKSQEPETLLRKEIAQKKNKRSAAKGKCTMIRNNLAKLVAGNFSRTLIKKQCQRLEALLTEVEGLNEDLQSMLTDLRKLDEVEKAQTWFLELEQEVHEAVEAAKAHVEEREDEATTASERSKLSAKSSKSVGKKMDLTFKVKAILTESKSKLEYLSEGVRSQLQGKANPEQLVGSMQLMEKVEGTLLEGLDQLKVLLQGNKNQDEDKKACEEVLKRAKDLRAKAQEFINIQSASREDSEKDEDLESTLDKVEGWVINQRKWDRSKLDTRESESQGCKPAPPSEVQLPTERVQEYVRAHPSRSQHLAEEEVDWIMRAVNNGAHTPENAIPARKRSKPYSKIPDYEGDILKWPQFASMVYTLIHKYDSSEDEKLWSLRSTLGVKPNELIECCFGPGAYLKALKMLRERYGNPAKRRELLAEKMETLDEVKEKDINAFMDHADKVKSLSAGLNGETLDESNSLVRKLLRKIPLSERLIWQGCKPQIASLNDYADWLFERAEAYRNLVSSTQIRGAINEEKKTKKASTNAVTAKETKEPSCSLCKNKGHTIGKCEQFEALNTEERFRKVRNLNLCFNCLRPGHRVQECKSKGCRENGCNKKHHLKLHRRTEGRSVASPVPSQFGEETTTSAAIYSRRKVAMGLIKVQAMGVKGREVEAIAFLDNGSDSTYISDKLRKKLGLKKGPTRKVQLNAAGGLEMDLNVAKTNLKLKNTKSGEQINIVAAEVEQKHMVNSLPACNWTEAQKFYDHLKDLPLDDLGENPKVDLLIGNDNIEVHKVRECRPGKEGDPSAERTIMGWVVRGPVHGSQQWQAMAKTNMSSHFIRTKEEEDLCHRFFDGELIATDPSHSKRWSEEDHEVMKRISQGLKPKENEPGYQAELPWKKEASRLQDNRWQAERRLNKLLHRFKSDNKFKMDYVKALNRYLNQGYAEVVYEYNPEEKPKDGDPRLEEGQFFVPHQGAYKNEERKKLRIVFDASAPANDELSLNKVMHCGPKLQNDIPDVVLKFREHKVAFIADIEDMYSQIELKAEDAKRHRFLWRENSKQQIKVIQMNRLAFGDGPSPCVAIAALRRAAEDHGSPGSEAVKAIQECFYMDDLLDSEPSLKKANQKAEEIDEILQKGGFTLKKWMSNQENFYKQEDSEDVTTVLGLKWNKRKDTLSLKTSRKMMEPISLTKANLMSKLASFYSPLGLHSCFVSKAKIKLAQMHLMGLDWDADIETLAKEVVKEKAKVLTDLSQWWKRWLATIPEVAEVEFDRCFCPFPPRETDLQIHTFSDASEEGMAAMLYIRAEYKDQVKVTLVMAKSRVAPRTPISVAKMELNGAAMAARLADFVIKHLRLRISKRHFWVDSSCTKAWINSTPSFFKPYVANRLGEIATLTSPAEWRHLPGEMNVSDEATRSSWTADAVSSTWIRGPEFLYKSEEYWPKDIVVEKTTTEIKSKWKFSSFSLGKKKEMKSSFDWERGSFRGWRNALGHLAGWLRRATENKRESGLKPRDLDKGERWLVRLAQRETFREELAALEQKKPANKSSELAPLDPFLDEEGLLRAGGRLGQSLLPFHVKHPIILSKRSRLAWMVVEHYHLCTHHAGTEYVLSRVRQKYWITNGREMVKKYGYFCSFCKKRRCEPIYPIMGELPRERTKRTPPFWHTSTDLFGPIIVRVSRNKTEKRWVALFADMVFRGVHLEVVNSLSAADYMVAFVSFGNTRGYPRYMYSDNGTNLVAAKKLLEPRWEEIRNEKSTEWVKFGVEWRLQTPGAPHQGGIHERLVGSAKMAMAKILDEKSMRRLLKENELRAVLAEVMGFLNSRPLLYTSTDPKDYKQITPNYFMIQRADLENPPGVEEVDGVRDSYQYAEGLANEIWRVWQDQYLPTMMARSKWRSREANLQVGDVVLLLEKGLPRNKWAMGRVVETYADPKGVVRNVRVRTSNGELRRPVARLCVLERMEEEQRPE